jgi:hypothetical protein
MRVIQASTKNELIQNISGLDAATREVYINARPSLEIVQKIFERAPEVKQITCPPSLFKQASPKVIKLASEKGCVICHRDVRVGRPNKYDNSVIGEILKKRSDGVAVKDIASQMQIPLRTVYYHLKTSGNNGH